MLMVFTSRLVGSRDKFNLYIFSITAFLIHHVDLANKKTVQLYCSYFQVSVIGNFVFLYKLVWTSSSDLIRSCLIPIRDWPKTNNCYMLSKGRLENDVMHVMHVVFKELFVVLRSNVYNFTYCAWSMDKPPWPSSCMMKALVMKETV